MPRHKDDDENDFCHKSYVDDNQKPKRKTKLPRIQPVPTRGDRPPPNHKLDVLHLKQYTDHGHLQMPSFPDYDKGNFHQTDHTKVDNVDSYFDYLEEELRHSNSAQRELELDRKRQAMFELRDRQVKFFRKIKQDNNEAKYIIGQARFSQEEQRPDAVLPACQKPKENSKKKKANKSKNPAVGSKDTIERDEEDYRKKECLGKAFPSNYQKEDVSPRIQEAEDYLVRYENDPNPWCPPSEDSIQFPEQPDMDGKEDHTKVSLAPIHRNRMRLPPVREMLYAGQQLPPVYKNPQKNAVLSTLPPPRQKNHHQKASTDLPQVKMLQDLNGYASLPPIQEHQSGTNQNITPAISTETNSEYDFDSGIELDTGYAFGISAHVVNDEELRNELRLDLRFVKTPVTKKESKASSKQSKNKTTRRRTRRQKDEEDRL